MRVVAFLIMAMVGFAAAQAQNVIVHEWGTFTSLQNEQGQALGGINVDDEPVPAFVHALPASFITNSPAADEKAAAIFTKGVFPRYHPQITMRLETPVVYFYDRRPMGGEGPLKLDLSVTFNGGYLSQFYPNADVGDAPNLPMRQPGVYVPITGETRHTLTWKDVQMGTDGKGPETKDKVWLAPREVKSDNITVGGESEKYVFYRGVGHLDGALKVNTGSDGSIGWRIPIQARHGGERGAWLLHVTDDGRHGVREPEIFSRSGKGFRPMTDADYGPEKLAYLRRQLRTALIREGLFADEAEAMLNTWEASYFKQPGMRVLYIVPREWTDHVLPIKVSADAQVVRVMVGRIDLVTPQQRELLKTISKPEEVKQLGRFAAAILNDEQRRNPQERLQALIRNARLTPALTLDP